jgi:hypothetical protein
MKNEAKNQRATSHVKSTKTTSNIMSPPTAISEEKDDLQQPSTTKANEPNGIEYATSNRKSGGGGNNVSYDILGRRPADAATATAADDDAPPSAEEEGVTIPPPSHDVAVAVAIANDPIPYSIEEFPELAHDDEIDHSRLANSFRRKLFPNDGANDNGISRPLVIAYSHLMATTKIRKRAQRRKNAVLLEYEVLREKYLEKKLELSLANDEVRGINRKVGAWTRTVFDLELVETCEWNDNYLRLRKYWEDNGGRLPPTNVKRAKDDEERFVSAWLQQM